MSTPPILSHKDADAPSVFAPAALLREARRQKGLAAADVPAVCVLDPDGDILRRLKRTGQAQRFDAWPCYHTELHTFALAGETAGIVGCAVGAPFAVLIAEQLFACGCRFLVSVTSAGQIVAAGPPPYFVIIDRALRDEGTSYHYAPPAEFADADPALVATARAPCSRPGSACSSGRAGPPTRRSAKPRRRSRRRAPRACWRSRWRRRRSTRLRGRAACRCSAWRTSPTRWGRPSAISRRAKPTAPPTR